MQDIKEPGFKNLVSPPTENLSTERQQLSWDSVLMDQVKNSIEKTHEKVAEHEAMSTSRMQALSIGKNITDNASTIELPEVHSPTATEPTLEATLGTVLRLPTDQNLSILAKTMQFEEKNL